MKDENRFHRFKERGKDKRQGRINARILPRVGVAVPAIPKAGKAVVSVHGGITFFRGTGASATAYLESDHHRADEYYLAEGSGLAERFVYGPEGSLEATNSLAADAYKSWVEWIDPQTGEVRGKPKGEARLRQSDGVIRDLPASPRFAEMTVNCDKSLSVAAALDSRVSGALDDAQREAAQAMSEYVGQNAVTRVGPRGDQRLVRVERFEAAAVVHKTSRAGDPHRHVHLQWNTRVFAEGKWRGLWTAPTLNQQAALRGIGESTIRSHAGLRQALADAGMTFDAATGKVEELSQHAELLSKRHAQVQQNLTVIETNWIKENPGVTPSAAVRQRWEFQAWALDRPSKKTSQRKVSESGWIDELRAAGLVVEGFGGGNGTPGLTLANLDQQHIADQATAICGGKKSAWSLHEIQGAVADQVAASGVIAERHEINSFIAETAHRALRESRSISDPRDGHMPDHVKHVTSEHVIAVEDEIRARFTARTVAVEAVNHTGEAFHGAGLEGGQAQAAEIISGYCSLGVVEGAAGSGKTTVLKSAKAVLDAEGRELVVVAPTLKAAQEASAALDSNAYSIHKLLYENGFRWDDNGRFTRLSPGESDPNTGRLYKGPKKEYRLSQGARLVVDEAGMVDQDTALALTQLADRHGAGLVLMGDRAQLPAVGRGGVLDMAAKVTFAHADMDVVHRFTDPEYAALSLRLRDRDKPAELFDQLYQGGHIRIHDSQEDAIKEMTSEAAATIRTGGTVALATPTNEVAVELNRAMQTEMADAGRTREAKHETTGSDGIALRHGDTVMTRENNSLLGVANRETYTVKNTHENGDLTVTQGQGKEPVRLPAGYVAENLHLGYASTEYGVQGATETVSAGLATEASNGAGTYVALTRGKEANTLHLVASTTEKARNQFVDIMNRDGADRGIEHAKAQLREQIEGLDLSTPPVPATVPEQRTSTTGPEMDAGSLKTEAVAQPAPEPGNVVPHQESGPDMANPEVLDAVKIIDASSLPDQLHLGQECATDWIRVTDNVRDSEFALGLKPNGALWTGTRTHSTPSGAATSWSETYYRRGYDQERRSKLSTWERLRLARKPEKLWAVNPSEDAKIVVLESVADLAAAAQKWPTAQGQVSFEAMAADGIDGVWVSKEAVTSSWSSGDREAPHAEVRAQFYGWEVESVAWLRTENINVGNPEPVNRERDLQIGQGSSTRDTDRLEPSAPPVPVAVGSQQEDPRRGSEVSTPEHQGEVVPSRDAAPTSAPVVDQQLRERRLAAAQWQLGQRTRLWEEGRAKYEAKHGRTPDEWVSARQVATDALNAAKEPVARLERSIPDQAERSFRANHVRDAVAVNTAYENLEKAGLFGKKQARKDLETVLERSEKTLGGRPAGPVPLEPDLVSVKKVRDQALKDGSPQMDHAKASQAKAQKKLAELDQAKPAQTFTMARKPEPTPAGTPALEAAKDAAYAGRQAQTARARAQERTGPTATPSKAPQASRGPER